MPKKAIIIGAGPAGLTAAWELLKRTDITPIIIEKDGQVGGISKTVDYKGNKMDFGPHRFFSKSDRVMKWWTNIMPLYSPKGKDVTISYQNKSRDIDTSEFLTTGEKDGLPPSKSMLVIQRLTRIYFLRKFFHYPIQLSIATLGKLGLVTTIKIVFSYLYARLRPRKPEDSLEDFMINKFGSVLYHIFFKDYTEKVWGMDCNKISADWGAQRIKGVSLSKAIIHAAKALTRKKKGDINQKETETSLIEQFLYPAKGAGAMWEEVARQVEEMGGKIIRHYDVKNILANDDTITEIEALNTQTGQLESLEGDYIISTMPVQELIAGLKGDVPEDVKEVAAGLIYRDFVYAGVLVKKMAVETLKDSWIYIQEKDVKVARMQIYNNWGPYMVANPDTVWLGLEYFCTKGDAIWSLGDAELQQLAVKELVQMGLVNAEDVLDTTVQRMEKTYPAYFGTFGRFDIIREYLNGYANLFLVGRNGMHKYNNSDHSMLTAMVTVDNIVDGVTSKANIWAINTEQEYHEEKETKKIEEKAITHQPDPVPVAAIAGGSQQGSFNRFLFPKHKRYLGFAAIAVIVQFIVFKYLYPFAGFIFADSYVYLQTAYLSNSINTYPVGYSNFLRLFSVFSNSDTILVALQYLLLQCASLLFVFSIFYLYNPGRFTRNLLFVFSVFSPVYLYLANYISSDALFTALSIGWFTTLIWLIEKPSVRLIILQVLLVYCAFTVRNNALYYPFITVLAMVLSRQKVIYKLAGISASVIIIGLFMWHTSQKYYEFTGIRQFSPFSGWQMANNALHAYRYVDSADRKPVPAQFRELDQMVRNYFDTTRDILKYPHELLLANTYYMWNTPSPLQQFVFKHYNIASKELPQKNWASMGSFYYAYGSYLIRQYPQNYLNWYLLPNAAKYYAPPVEFLEDYNMGKDTVASIAKYWFRYKDNKVSTRLTDFHVNTLNFYPILIGCVNVVFLISMLFVFMLKGFRQNRQALRLLLLIGGFWVANFGFSVFAAPVALRFQVFPLLVFFAFASLMIEYIYIMAFKSSDLPVTTFRQVQDLSVTR